MSPSPFFHRRKIGREKEVLMKKPYLYNYAGAPHKTQEWVRRIGEEEYNHTAGGLSGVRQFLLALFSLSCPLSQL